MTTATTTRTDEEMQREVLEELKWDARVQPNEIGVMVKNGVVTLTGYVDSYIKKWAAERAAERVRGVVAVANDIKVRLPADDKRTDADIATTAAHALEWNTLVPTDRVKVTVSNGWVTLRGEVDWEYQRREAVGAVPVPAARSGTLRQECVGLHQNGEDPRAGGLPGNRVDQAVLPQPAGAVTTVTGA